MTENGGAIPDERMFPAMRGTVHNMAENKKVDFRYACRLISLSGIAMAVALTVYHTLYGRLLLKERTPITLTKSSADETEEGKYVFSEIGSAGDEVLLLQRRLQELGYLTKDADGIYDETTASAVRKYQQEHGLSADGVAGPKTLLSLGIVEASDLSSFGKTAILARIVWAEAGDYGYLVQLVTAQTLLNRLQHEDFGEILTAIAYPGWAWNEKKRERFAEEPPDVAIRAAEDALNGMSPVTDALYWYSVDTCPDEFLSERELCAEIGNIRFVK